MAEELSRNGYESTFEEWPVSPMTTRTISNHRYQEDYLALAAARPGPAWLADLRAAGWERFSQIGFPTARRGNERWKYTAVAPIARVGFVYPFATRENVEAAESDFGFSPVSTVSAFDQNEGEVRQHLGSLAPMDDDGFVALNTAFLRDVAVVRVPDGSEAPVAVCINHGGLPDLSGENGQQYARHPRTLIMAGRNANLTVVETYTGPKGPRYFTNAVTEIVVGEGSQVEHYRLLSESSAAFHVGTTRVRQEKDSSFSSASFALGTALARNDFAVTLDGPGAFCSLNGLYYTGDGQHIDNLISIDHAQPHCTSRLNYKGILDGNSRAVFGGEVMVRRNAQKSDARQSDKNLLLSEDAEVDSKPSLMIYADDVQCAHGATAGQIDAQTLFYLRSRGLDLETASRMLVLAFASEIIDIVRPDALRGHLESLYSSSIVSRQLPVIFGAQ